MIITTINNNKLYIQFDKLVKTGMIEISDTNTFKKRLSIQNSEFEIIDITKSIGKLSIRINIDNEEQTHKTINLKH